MDVAGRSSLKTVRWDAWQFARENGVCEAETNRSGLVPPTCCLNMREHVSSLRENTEYVKPKQVVLVGFSLPADVSCS